MAIDRKILKEIERYRQINRYILEQDAPADLPPEDDAIPPDLGALAPPPGGGEAAPPPAPSAATPPPAPAEGQPIDVEADDDVTKIDDEGDSEEGGANTEELEVTDLVDSQKNIETKQDEYFNNLFSQLSNLESKLSEMDSIMNKLNSLETKIEKYREKTPEEKLELRTYDSYPFNQKLSDFFDDKQIDMKKSGKNEYILTPDEVTDINVNDIKSSFNAGYSDEDYEPNFK
jgi:hypothetical protein